MTLPAPFGRNDGPSGQRHPSAGMTGQAGSVIKPPTSGQLYSHSHSPTPACSQSCAHSSSLKPGFSLLSSTSVAPHSPARPNKYSMSHLPLPSIAPEVASNCVRLTLESLYKTPQCQNAAGVAQNSA